MVKSTGDGFLAEFASAQAAVLAAAEIQSAIARKEQASDPRNRIAYRMGINLGDVIFDGGDVFGDGVNVAARLERLSQPGGLCIADGVHQIVADRLDLPFRDLGSQRLKNISRPIRVWHWAHETQERDVAFEALLATKLDGGVFLDAELTAPWSFWSHVGPEDCAPFAMEPKHIISYHYVIEGGFILKVGEEDAVPVRSARSWFCPTTIDT